ncbi:SLBB domain-containing protein [Mariniblastus sp.]|nr:SLBB domain-containing protein [Mariniblastus sp.]MDC0283718.1 SLBB domain-containing protein [Mariniblastus sp.]MDC3255901.1 SLBB domain-containing protein [bacterium]
MQKPNANREKIIELLEHAGGVTEESVREVHQQTGIAEADIWGTGLFYTLLREPGKRIRLCDGLTCQMFGADSFANELTDAGKMVERVSCLGQCDLAPASLDEEMELVTYAKHQTSISPPNEFAMNLAGEVDLTYSALAKVREMAPEDVISALESSGLQGRGGAGFPAHFKWTSVRQQAVTERYVICNADEAEPGTFKDRELILRQTHKMLEGLAIAALVIEAKEIYIYIRGEYTNEYRAIERALGESKDALKEFEFMIVKGHGAYICGEETALLESLEGKRGMPRLKPPYPTESGFRGKPSLIHNVETIACVPSIIHRGGDWFRALGKTEAGSKLYCISGHVVAPGVYELPLGVSLDELVEAAGGYVGNPIAFSPGGASSGFLPITERDLPLDYKHLADAGSMLGSAGVVVINDTVDMAKAAAWQLEFFERESCGQCAPCRIGTQYIRRQVDQYVQLGDPASLEMTGDVGWEMEEGSICGLGMVAAKPLESARKHFPDAFKTRD